MQAQCGPHGETAPAIGPVDRPTTCQRVVALAAAALPRDALALVLCGGRGTRLGAMTDWRAKPAVPFGSRFRIVDFTLANCINSSIRRVAVLTQYKAQGLIRHVQQGWALNAALGEFVEVVPAQQRTGEAWYAGTADAVYQNLDLLALHRPAYVIVLGGDHVYKMDYSAMLAEHVAHGADVTVACIEVPIEEACEFGVIEVDQDCRIIGFEEKPRTPRPLPGTRDRALASMGIYAFDTDTLVSELTRDAGMAASSHDFGINVVPDMVRNGRHVYAHSFSVSCVRAAGPAPYWRDVGTLDAYWEANLDLVRENPGLDLFDAGWPVPSCPDRAMPTRFVVDAKGRHAAVEASLIGSGCIIGAAEIERSVVFSDVQVHAGACITESLLLPQVDVAAGVRLRRVIVDSCCRLPAGLAAGFDPAADARRFQISPRGITLITPEMLGQPMLAPHD